MKKIYLLTSALATCAFAAPNAIAQEDTSASTKTSDTIVVSAQRREQDILDVPVAVTTLGADELEAKQVNNVLDIISINPSVQGTLDGLSSPLHNTPIRIRGIGTGGGNPGFEGAVAMYVDEVFRSRAGAALTSFFDIQSVDILRGPQGTLFGKNTTAGAIVQKTRKAEIGETSGYISAEYGSFNTVEVEGAVNVPLGDNGAFRLSGLINDTDGYITDALTGEDVAGQETQAIRAQFSFEPSDRLAFRLVGEWSDFSNQANYTRSVRIDNRDPVGAQAALFAPLALNPGTGTGYWYWDVTVPGDEPDPFARETSTSLVGNNELEQWGINGYIDFYLNDAITIRSITSYREIDSENLDGDWDFGPIDFGNKLDGFQTFETFSQEFLFQGDIDLGNMGLDWTAGVHYFSEEIEYTRELGVGAAFGAFFTRFGAGPADPVFGNTDTIIQNTTNITDEESWGVFGHVSLDVTDTLSVIAGGRWNNITKDGSFINNNGEGAEYYDLVAGTTFGTLLVGAGVTTAFNWDTTLENEEWTYNFALQWRPVDEIQLYASYSRGFKAGGFNMTTDGAGGVPTTPTDPIAVPLEGVTDTFTLPLFGDVPRFYTPFDPELSIFAPEFVDAYEVGMRYQLPGGLISLTGFWSDYSDLQTSVFTGITFQVINAGTARTRGIELEGFYNVTDNLTLNGGLTFLDAQYGDDVQGLPGGRDLVQAPDVALSVGAQYNRPLTDNINMFANLVLTYTTEYFAAEGGCQDAAGNETPFSDCDPTLVTSSTGGLGNALANEIQDGYALLNIAVGLNLPGDFDVSVFCNNCTDTEYFGWRLNQPFVAGSILGNPNAPRTWGGKISKSF